MESKDYYRIMGLARDATPDEIKCAYRHLAHKYHPDVSQEDRAELRFKEIGEAYEVLRDPQKRASYDRHHPSRQASGDFVDFSEFLSRRSHHQPPRSEGSAMRTHGADHHVRVRIDLEDAYQGATRSVRLHMPQADTHGHVTLQERMISFLIPRGIGAGEQIRLPGQGARTVGPGQPGDLYLEVQFRSHARYRVDRHDVYFDLPLTPWEAVLGAEVRAPTPSGWVEVTIPPGSTSGSRLRIRGRGIPAGTPGDFYFVLQIAQPPADNLSSRAFYRVMAERFKSFTPRAGLENST